MRIFHSDLEHIPGEIDMRKEIWLFTKGHVFYVVFREGEVRSNFFLIEETPAMYISSEKSWNFFSGINDGYHTQSCRSWSSTKDKIREILKEESKK